MGVHVYVHSIIVLLLPCASLLDQCDGAGQLCPQWLLTQIDRGYRSESARHGLELHSVVEASEEAPASVSVLTMSVYRVRR